MYYLTSSSLTESLDFTIRNLNDLFTVPANNYVKHTEEKLRRVEEAFNMYYKYDEETEDAILLAIGKLIKQDEFDPIDIPKIDRVHHLKLHIQTSFGDRALANADFIKFYTVLYRELYVPSLPYYMTKYTLLKFIRGRFIVFITFDEDEISAVHIPVSENQYDITSPIYLIELPINKSIFKK